MQQRGDSGRSTDIATGDTVDRPAATTNIGDEEKPSVGAPSAAKSG